MSLIFLPELFIVLLIIGLVFVFSYLFQVYPYFTFFTVFGAIELTLAIIMIRAKILDKRNLGNQSKEK